MSPVSSIAQIDDFMRIFMVLKLSFVAPENPRYKMPEVFVSPEKKRVLLQEFDTTCDVCAVYLGTLKKAISHYKKYHKMEGYIKCCKFKFKKDIHVDDHIKWHVQPDIFK